MMAMMMTFAMMAVMTLATMAVMVAVMMAAMVAVTMAVWIPDYPWWCAECRHAPKNCPKSAALPGNGIQPTIIVFFDDNDDDDYSSGAKHSKLCEFGLFN